MIENGKVVKHDFTKLFGKQVELQARKVHNGYRAEWSLDGDKWNCLVKTYSHADDAIQNARTGAFIAQVHQNAVNRRKAE